MIKRIIAILLYEGPKYGYHLKEEKGAYLLGICESVDEAKDKRQMNEESGLSENIIHIHPDNCANNEDDGVVKIVGTYIGTDEYIQKRLRGHLESLKEVAEK